MASSSPSDMLAVVEAQGCVTRTGTPMSAPTAREKAARKLKWCTTHNEVAWEWGDESIGCMYDLIVEASSPVHVLTDLPEVERLREVAETARIFWDAPPLSPLWAMARHNLGAALNEWEADRD